MTLALVVGKEDCERARRHLLLKGLLDRSMQPMVIGGRAYLPVLEGASGTEAYGTLVRRRGFIRRRRPTPYERIVERSGLQAALASHLPRRWKVIGDVLLLRLPEELWAHADRVAEAYARVLGVRCVLHVGSISGEFRVPECTLLYGRTPETVHRENGIRYRLDPSRLMFAKGNTHERMRVARLVAPGERVLDMFAGIGYFAIPVAVHGSPSVVYACEKNRSAYRYLCENIALNGVEGTVVPVLGDSRVFRPPTECDRILLGYIPERGEWCRGRVAAWEHLGHAVDLLASPDRGVIHLHVLERRGTPPARSFEGMAVKGRRRVKSYAPGIDHVVYDLEGVA